jgi:hypothetical protein
MTSQEQEKAFSAGPVSAAEGLRIAETCAINAVRELQEDHNNYLRENEAIRQEGFEPDIFPVANNHRAVGRLTAFYLEVFTSRGLITLGPK